MDQKDKNKIMHKRWIITGIIAIAIILFLHLWFFIGIGIICLASGLAVILFIDWITGADLDGPTNIEHSEDDISDEEKSFWDYMFWSELFNHKN